MHSIDSKSLIRRPGGLLGLLCLLLTLAVGHDCHRLFAGERLSLPLPQPAQNGAIHYQRAILFLTAVEPSLREVLEKPLWEIVTPQSTADDIGKLDKLVIESRHAIRSALTGAEQLEANFGLDIRQYMVSSLLPYSQPMVELGRLVAIHGMQREASEKWEEAAKIYFATMRMGRHMAHQPTLAEAVAGIEILETAYYALGHWAACCPDASLVEEASDLLATLHHDMIRPARTMQFEASILQMRLNAMRDAFPDGAWAEMVLESMGLPFPSDGPEGMRKAAIEAATSRGVPKEAFENKQSFDRYMTELSSIYVEMAEESALCMCHAQPSSEAIRRGQAIFQKYKPLLLKTKNTNARDPAKIAALFAVHEAELTLTRLILAISAAKTDAGFPADLSDVAKSFGGQLPTSPYDGSELKYELLEDGKGFSVLVQEAQVGEITLPKINFKHLPGDAEK